MAQKMIISIDSLRLHARIGVLEQEIAVGGEFEISVSLSYPPALEAAVTDSLECTVNYAEVVEIIRHELREPMRLIETACLRIKNALFDRFPLAAGGEVKVTKILPPIAGAQLIGASATLKW